GGGDRWQRLRQRCTATVAAVRRGRRQEAPVEEGAAKGGVEVAQPTIAVRGAPARPAASAARDNFIRRIPLLPALIYVILVTQIPFLLTIYYSFFSWNLLQPGSFQFAGLENYAILVTRSSFRIALANTVVLTLGAVIISVVVGVAVALVLHRGFFGRGTREPL